MIIDTFRGISPRTPEHVLGRGLATRAHNVDLSHGSLHAWREPLPVRQLPAGTMTLEMYGCCAYGWDSCVSVARWLPDCPRLYITGREDYPEVGLVSLNDCGIEYQRLGVPMPSTLPLVSYITVPDKTVESSIRYYVFTYVNNLGEESAPSYPSSALTVNDGQAVTVSGWAAQSPEYHVEKVRIYRLATGFRTGAEKEQEFTSDYLLVDEVPVTQGQYVDRKKDLDLQWALNTREVREPPANLQQITAIDGVATLVGFVGNKLYFTKNSQPWNWPLELEVTLDDNIVGLAADDGKLYITTTGRPYVVDGIADCGDRPCRPVVKSDYPFADIGCGYAHSRTITPFGLVYASAEGLVLLNSRDAPTVLTDPVLAARDWAVLRPDTTRLAYWRGWIICVTDEVSFMFLMDRRTYQEQASIADMTTISDTPVDMVLSDSGALLLLGSDGIVSQWDAGTTYRPYEWVCPIYVGSHHWWPAAMVEVDGSTVITIEGENGALFSRTISSNRAFRTKRLGRNRKHYVRLAGTGEVTFIRMGETMVDESNGR